MGENENVIVNVAITSANRSGTFTINEEAVALRIRGTSGNTYSNLKISPMIVSGTTVPTEFSPYANICPITGWTGANMIIAGKNMAQPYKTDGSTSTSYGITFTYNSDGSITANGTNNGSGNSYSMTPPYFYLPPGTYKKPTRTSNGIGFYVQYVVNSSTWTVVTGGDADSDTFTITEEMSKHRICIRARVEKNTTVDNVTIYPYIYSAPESDLTYEQSLCYNFGCQG